MTTRFDFNSYKIVFNDHQFQGEGYLIALPPSPNDMFGGEVIVCSRPPHQTYKWLIDMVNQNPYLPKINGTISLERDTIHTLTKGIMKQWSPAPNRSTNLYEFRFYFEVIDPRI